MTRQTHVAVLIAIGTLVGEPAAPPARADESFARVADEASHKIVKLFGAGGLRGLVSYGTGILVSPQGHVLTVASHLLLTQDLTVHLADGRRCHAEVVVMEPELDAALLKIDKVEDLPYFDVGQAAQAPLRKAGEWILAFSNEFQIATRDEPVSVQRGVIAARAQLHGRRGIYDAPYNGEVYVIDAATNNAGAAGGAVTDHHGQLIGMIGKEVRNTLSDTWVNYAVPIQFLAPFVEKAIRGEYKPVAAPEIARNTAQAGYHGIVLVPSVVERTPPYIEEVLPDSPAARAGLRPDDLIVYLDGQQVLSTKGFRDLMSRIRPGATVRLEARRADRASGGDRLVTVEMKLEPLPTPSDSTGR